MKTKLPQTMGHQLSRHHQINSLAVQDAELDAVKRREADLRKELEAPLRPPPRGGTLLRRFEDMSYSQYCKQSVGPS